MSADLQILIWDKRHLTLKFKNNFKKRFELTSGCSFTGTYTFSFSVTVSPSGSGSWSGSFRTPFIWNNEALTLAISIKKRKNNHNHNYDFYGLFSTGGFKHDISKNWRTYKILFLF